MARYDAMDQDFEEIELYGKPALFTPLRIERNTVPKGLYLYEVRHDDETWSDPVEIGRGIFVNHFGTVITTEKLRLDKNGFRDTTLYDFNLGAGNCSTITEYQQKYQTKTKKEPHR